MDYERLIDEETWDFIQKTGELYPDDAVEMSIDEQRRIYDSMAREFRAPRPDVVSLKNSRADGVPVRIYTAGDPTRTVLYCHGGGFVVGGSTATTTFAPRSASRPATGWWRWITAWRRSTSTPPRSKTPGRC